MWASGSAAVGIVTELVDVDATLSIGIVASDVPCDGSWGGLGFLFEGNGAGDLGVTSNCCNYKRENRVSIGQQKIDKQSIILTRMSKEMLVRKEFRARPSGLRILH